MDLQALNPKVFEMWSEQKALGSAYFQPSTTEEISEIERLMGTDIPGDYREFLEKYSTVIGADSIGAYFFPCRFKDKSVIAGNFSLVPWAKLTIAAIKALHNPHPSFEGVGPRVPKELIPLTRDNNATLLIDLRPDSFGHVHFLPVIKKKTFGAPGYTWDNIGYVAPSFTDFIKELGTEEELKERYAGWKVI